MTNDQLKHSLESRPELLLGLVFGSDARNQSRPDSDLDIAVAAAAPLTWQEKMRIVADLAPVCGCPIDLVDLRSATGVTLQQALTTGKVLFCRDLTLYADLIKKMWFDQADFQPYVQRILRQRRQQWIGI